MYLKGYGTMQIADYLSKNKVPIPSDYNHKKRGVRSLTYGLWAQSTVRFILSNEIYTGTIVQGKRKKVSFKSKKFIDIPEEDWVRVEGMHEAIVSRSDFEKARKMIENTKGARIVLNDYIFKSMIRCYECGGYIGITKKDKNGNIYGRCQRYARYGKFDVCTSHNFNYEVFEKQMIDILRQVCKIYKDRKKLEEIAKKAKSKEEQEMDINKKIQTYKEQIEKENRKLGIMYEDRLSGIISIEEYKENSEKIKENIKMYKQNIEDLEIELIGNKNQQPETEKLESLIDEFLNVEKPTKEIIRAFFEKIVIHEDKQLDVYFNFKPLQEISESLDKIVCAKKKYGEKVG